MSEITHWINGKTFDDSAKRHGEIFNPATGEVSKKVAFGTAATVDVAVKAATDAFT
jgi:malonate-semialdehyde dehydrogenase (acetylating) / methylmalonate-semialdehyde dehydrogenase